MYFKALSEKLIKNMELRKINDTESELIKINTMMGPAIYFNEDDFNDNVLTYIKNKINNNDLLTDNNNHISVLKGLNIIYLDGDFYFNDNVESEDKESICLEYADVYTSCWIEQLESRNYSNIIYFTFTPENFPKSKGGFHTFIYLNKNLSIDSRIEIYNDIIKSIELDDSSIRDFDLHTIFDIAPIKSLQCLIPFAKKKGGRNYKLNLDFTNFDTNKYVQLYKACIHNNQCIAELADNTTVVIDDEYLLGPDDDEIFDDDIMKTIELFNKWESNQSNKNWVKDFGKCNQIVIEFMQSLAYLSENHSFWKILSNNELRLKEIMDPLMRYIYMNYFVENNGDLTYFNIEKLAHTITKILQPLIKRTVKKGEDTNRCSYKSIFEHAFNWRKYGIEDMFVSKNISYKRNAKPQELDLSKFFKEWSKLSSKQKEKMLNDYSLLNDYGEAIKISNKKKDESDEENEIPEEYLDNMTKGEWLRKCWDRMQILCRDITNKWTIFVKKIIMDGITTEIYPFKEVVDFSKENPRDCNLSFDDVLPEQLAITNNIETALIESFYMKTMKKWTLMFFFIHYYNSKQHIEAIREVMNAFIRMNVWVKDLSLDKKSKSTILIYNIKQTRSLSGFPYNQWIEDSGEELEKWLMSIYLNFIKPLMETIEMPTGLTPLLNNLQKAGIPIPDNTISNLKPIRNIGVEIKSIVENTLRTFDDKFYNPPEELPPAQSNNFPMRNGWLIWEKDKYGNLTGEYKFSKNNRKSYMLAHTNITWDYTYDYNCKPMQDALKMIEQIFPDEDGRIYNLRCMSTVLVGCFKDTFHIMYDTGAGGKTTWINYAQAALGNKGFNTHVRTIENGKNIILNITKGLASTMKADTVLISNKSTHDEGGKTELVNVRLCSIQEPDTRLSGGTLNGAIIKEILSGTATSVRGIYKSNMSVIFNPYIVFQTNILPKTDDTSLGFRRRLSVYRHLAKFVSDDTPPEFKSLKYAHKADPDLARKIVEDPKYWQAWFYILLPYCQEVIKNKWIPISKIPKPECVSNMINIMLENNTNSIGGWLAQNTEPSDDLHAIISFDTLVFHIINENSKDKSGFLYAKTQSQQRRDISTEIENTFGGRIYKLRNEWYKVKRFGKYEIQAPDIHEDIKNLSMIEFKQKYLESNAESSVQSSRLFDKSDIYILGIKVLTLRDEDEENDYSEYSLKQV